MKSCGGDGVPVPGLVKSCGGMFPILASASAERAGTNRGRSAAGAEPGIARRAGRRGPPVMPSSRRVFDGVGPVDRVVPRLVPCSAAPLGFSIAAINSRNSHATRGTLAGMDDPLPGFVRIVLVCTACRHQEVLDVHWRTLARRYDVSVAARPWRCVACGDRSVALPSQAPGSATGNSVSKRRRC